MLLTDSGLTDTCTYLTLECESKQLVELLVFVPHFCLMISVNRVASVFNNSSFP